MARELSGYRDTIARLNEAYPGREVLGVPELERITGKCYRTIKRWFDEAGRPLVGGCTSKDTLAWVLCKRFGK